MPVPKVTPVPTDKQIVDLLTRLKDQGKTFGEVQLHLYRSYPIAVSKIVRLTRMIYS